MTSFVIYDLVLLAIFILFTFAFLYIRRSNLKRQGILYLYRTRFGLEVINYTSTKFSKILRPLQYFIIASGYALMGIMVYMLIQFSYVYIKSPDIARAIKVPVIMPLIPYLPELFKIDFLPPFYFTYWIIIIAIIAIPHEFAHGIIARLNKIKVHSTGFGFLGPFLAAFVEPDEKQTEKSSKFAQLSVLSAGTFANILTVIFFGLILWGFFAFTFSPAGVNFNAYSSDIINISSISLFNGIPLQNIQPSSLNSSDNTFSPIISDNRTFFATPSFLKKALENNASYIIVYENSPAFNARLAGAITEINGVKTTSPEELKNAILANKPGDNVTIKTIIDKEVKTYNIELANKSDKPFLGIGITPFQSKGMLGKIFNLITKVKDPLIYYDSSLGDAGIFIYDLLWWIVLISLSVALVNMLPLGIFDGGRFFMLTVWGITGSRKIGEKAFSVSTWLILALIALLMVKWLFAILS